MGKRSKSCTSGEVKANTTLKSKKIKLVDNEDSKEVQESLPIQLSTSKVKNMKAKNKDKTEKAESTYEAVEIITSAKKIKKKNKGQLNSGDPEENEVFNDNIEVTDPNAEIEELPKPTVNKKAKTSKKNKPKSGTTNKKIIFGDDQPDEIKDHIKKQKKPKNTDLSQEEDVKDEDIDKFCDEIDEEDNVQYENWVKLIEAKLNSNKKKPK